MEVKNKFASVVTEILEGNGRQLFALHSLKSCTKRPYFLSTVER